MSFARYSKNRQRNGVTTQEVAIAICATSDVGQRFTSIFVKHGLLNPRIFNDFLVAQKLRKLLDNQVNLSDEGLISLIYLAYQTSSQKSQGSQVIKKKPIEYFFNLVSATPQSFDEGIQQGKKYISEIEP